MAFLAIALSFTQATEEAPETPKEPSSGFSEIQNNFLVEVIMINIILMFAVNYFIGKKKNDSIAASWMQRIRPLLVNNFSHIGVGQQQGDGGVLREANHVFKYYASGRYNCGYFLATLELTARQDIFTTLFWNYLIREGDKFTIEIPVKMANPAPVVFALVKSSQARNTRNNLEDLKTFTKPINIKELSQNLTCLAESEEVAKQVLSGEVLSIVNQLQPYIDTLHITDRETLHPGYTLKLSCKMLLPTTDSDEVMKLATLALALCDNTSMLKLSQAAKATAEKERSILEKERQKEVQQQREEERLRKKEEQKKLEEERAKKLSKEKQRKLEEKEHKKKLKKQTPKFKMVKA